MARTVEAAPMPNSTRRMARRCLGAIWLESRSPMPAPSSFFMVGLWLQRLQGSCPGSASVPAADGEEQAAFAAERAYPTQLCDRTLHPPVVDGGIKQVVWLVLKNGAGIGAQVLDVVLREPPLDFRDRVGVFHRMLILIPQPGVTSRRLCRPVAKNGITRNDRVSGEPARQPPKSRGKPGDRVVHTDHDRPARPSQVRQPRERRPRI